MAWQISAAEARIRKFIDSVPASDIVVEDFVRYALDKRARKAILGQPQQVSVVDIPRNRDRLMENGRETEASHRRALEFLHAHYCACDTLIEAFEIQRVDFHGSRLHAVVLTPEGPEGERERVHKALAFAAAFRRMVA